MVEWIPGEGPLLGPGSAFAPAALAPLLRAREEARLETVLAAIAARGLETGWMNPPLSAGLGALAAPDRDRLLLAPDFRRWVTRLLGATRPGAAPDAALPVRVQAAWNQIAIPWLAARADGAHGALWLLVFADGTVPLPGSGLAFVPPPGTGRRVRMVIDAGRLAIEAEDGTALAAAGRSELIAAAAGSGPVPPGFTAARRLRGTEIEVEAGTEDGAAALDEAEALLAAGWPGGHALVTGLVRRIRVDPDSDLNSKTEGELPGVVILGRQRADAAGIAELLVHEAAHLLTYEVTRLGPSSLLPAPDELRPSPFSRVERPAYMLLHGMASFLAQAVAIARLRPASGAAVAGGGVAAELERLDRAAADLRAHHAAHGAEPHPFVAAVLGELDHLQRAFPARSRGC